MLKLKPVLYGLPEFAELQKLLEQKPAIRVKGLYGSFQAAAINFIKETRNCPILAVQPDGDAAEKLVDDLRSFMPAGESFGESQAVYFPSDEVVPFDKGLFTPALYSMRLNALAAAVEQPAPVIVTTPSALLRRVPDPAAFKKNILQLKVGEDFERDLLIQWLAESGYQRAPIIDEIGQFSVRGGIIDVFSFESEAPHRLEFFGDTIESIREFDVLSQLSIQQVEKVRMVGKIAGQAENALIFDYFPAWSIIFWEDIERCRRHLKEWWEEAAARFAERKGELKINSPEEYYLPLGQLSAAAKKFQHVFHSHLSEIQNSKFKIQNPTFEIQYPKSKTQIPTSEISDPKPVVSPSAGSGYTSVEPSEIENPTRPPGESAIAEKLDLHFHASPPPVFHGNVKLLVEHLQRSLGAGSGEKPQKIYILHDGEASRSRLEDILEQEMGELPPLTFIDEGLHQGFTLPRHSIQCLTDHEIFNRLRMRRRKRRLRISGSLIRSLQTLEYGDYVVHIDYGIGKYVGVERIQVAGIEKECIKLLYEDDDALYVTLDKLSRIQRYVSEEGFQPKLTKLGSAEWERVKGRTRKSVEHVARDLVELYAKRLAQEGHAFNEDGLWQKELEASFPFEDTPDQARAAEEVKQDMESPRPMDRLVCGDVGYGKTEVAIRAAFKAVMDGRQVAVLVPTTILAQQHYDTFRERMMNFPLQIEVLSRFRSRAQQQRALEKLAGGEVDVVIGTHRLLSKDVTFKDLGLLIVDEEQRFGVTHKERLKQLKVTVDTLTLTATPIPRTLHMSLMGARDLSIVDTPPTNRRPIITEITTWDQQLIYKAITYEIERGGQVFFVHNRVQTIEAVTGMLRNIVPRARFAIAHGQMREHQLEQIMDDFHHKRIDVLVATMIIENGLDIPNCNTIIINRADKFGLAQLYQLRGRVGRSDRQAYAYLIIPPQERLNDLALKRLYAIEEFSDLGSGMKIAMRDLEIRGAGNLLGHSQSGHINAVGYDLYQKILREAVEAIQEEKLPEQFIVDRMPIVDASVEIDMEMYFPDDYIPSPNEKVIIYHRLLNLDALSSIDNLVNELRDRFGPLPEPAENLVEMVRIKKLASQLFIKQVKIRKNQMTIVFDERASARDAFIEKELPRYINQSMAPLKFVQTEQLRALVTLNGKTEKDRVGFAKYFLRNL
ncbi:MAG: transcription-repair coupling factor [Calditrichaceae bacterium]|nr:transcription-repair coupling factor [Calditrichia bacterium]NUQ43706.1 transcription-repair coupling factor [Calditrichaceae bacterium]